MLTRMPDGSWLDPAKVVAVYESSSDETDIYVRMEDGEDLPFMSQCCEPTPKGLRVPQDLADEIARRINDALRKEDGE